MRIAFATTLSRQASTITGRILPVAEELQRRGHEVHVLLLEGTRVLPPSAGVQLYSVGSEPFTRTPQGKQRRTGLALLTTVLSAAWRTYRSLHRLNPDLVIIAKPHPHNVLGVRLWRLSGGSKNVVLDSDDFEVAVTVTTSLLQRLALHWAERVASAMSQAVVAATPFLSDHFKQLTAHKKTIIMIPTGIMPGLPRVTSHPTRPTVLYLGSLSIRSGHRVDLLVPILERLRSQYPTTQLLIAGDGDDVTYVQEAVTRAGLTDSVSYHGRFTAEDISVLLERATLVIDPIDASIAARAKSSFRVMLAAATGMPVVTSNIGIRPYLIPAELHDRFFATPGDAVNYAEKISALLQQPLSTPDQEALRRHARQFQWDVLTQQYETVLKA
jgi:glycosyltransferase involved in cell wall biosynthesis